MLNSKINVYVLLCSVLMSASSWMFFSMNCTRLPAAQLHKMDKAPLKTDSIGWAFLLQKKTPFWSENRHAIRIFSALYFSLKFAKNGGSLQLYLLFGEMRYVYTQAIYLENINLILAFIINIIS